MPHADDWRWSSLWRWIHGDEASRALLSPWPIPRPRNWRWRVNQPLTAEELQAVRRSVARGQPYGSEGWVEQMVKKLGLEATVRPRGRPKKQIKGV